jgi:hypothetical protein
LGLDQTWIADRVHDAQNAPLSNPYISAAPTK